jgi:hypothetical protein
MRLQNGVSMGMLIPRS